MVISKTKHDSFKLALSEVILLLYMICSNLFSTIWSKKISIIKNKDNILEMVTFISMQVHKCNAIFFATLKNGVLTYQYALKYNHGMRQTNLQSQFEPKVKLVILNSISI